MNVVSVNIENADAAKAIKAMEEGTAVKEGIFAFEALPIRSFPGDSLA